MLYTDKDTMNKMIPKYDASSRETRVSVCVTADIGW